ncbi:MAG: hypothetical protein JWM37_7 [Candidatus Saccharibacteria bacterium]|nr:hypothetical protein [Candidatus Saccharibacteria bacterium]
MTDIEIPYKENRDWRYRLFEILPGFLSWSLLALPIVLSLINVTLACIFILAYLLIYVSRTFGVNVRALQGYYTMQQHKKLPWQDMLKELEKGEVAQADVQRPKWHYDNLLRRQVKPPVLQPSDVIHLMMVATYNESREVLEPTIQAVLASQHDMKKVMLVIAYEERGGAEVEATVKELIKEYGDKFLHAAAFKHPKDTPREIRGKGGNITYAARQLEPYFKEHNIDPLRVLVTTLDADNRPDPQYIGALTYLYCVAPDPARVSIQPISMYTNNIWDAPAPMRVIATGNSFYNIVLALRQHVLRNFSAHAQSLAGLQKTDYWSVRTIVEDGHQFWRSYFTFDGQYQMLPLYVPIYQDAVLANGYVKTLKAQFIQLRRWTYGASDIAYVVSKGYMHKNKVPRGDLLTKVLRLIESHVTWAAAPLIAFFGGFIPAMVNHDSYAANQLPIIISNIQTVALIGFSASIFVSFKTLPPKPARYKRRRSLWMLLQWVYLPVTTIVYNSLAALYSQTRLMFGKYLDKFDVTEKAVRDENKNYHV